MDHDLPGSSFAMENCFQHSLEYEGLIRLLVTCKKLSGVECDSPE